MASERLYNAISTLMFEMRAIADQAS